MCWNDFRNLGIEAVAHTEEIVKIVGLSDENIRKAAQDTADDGLWVSTTIAIIQTIPDQISNLEGKIAQMPEVKYLNPQQFDSRWDPKNNQWPKRALEDDLSGIPDYIDAVKRTLVALHDAGALLLSGTDTSIPFMIPGFGLHNELEAMVNIGLSPYDALRTSTYNPAKYLGGLDEFGTIGVGKRADLVLLDKNPLEDITNTKLISGVMVRGRWYSRADLDTMLEEVAKANQ